MQNQQTSIPQGNSKSRFMAWIKMASDWDVRHLALFPIHGEEKSAPVLDEWFPVVDMRNLVEYHTQQYSNGGWQQTRKIGQFVFL